MKTLDRFEELLASERLAIVKMDAGAVDAIALEKQRCALELSCGDPRVCADPRDREQLERIRQKLRDNCVLLAHARDLTKTLVQMKTQGQRRGVRVSVAG